MLRRQLAPRAPSRLCQICESIVARRAIHAKAPYPSIAARRSSAARGQSTGTPSPRLPIGVLRHASTATSPPGPETGIPKGDLPELGALVRTVSLVKEGFLAQKNIPSEDRTLDALIAFGRAAESLMDTRVQHIIRSAEHQSHQSDTPASSLLEIDTNGSKSAKAPSRPQNVSIAQVRAVVKEISDAAYSIIAHPNVFITPKLLEAYVAIQNRLGRPETLPHVLRLYATKPLPREAAGTVKYVDQNPSKMSNAIEIKVAEMALDTAIEAKNLDAAVGIVENAFASKASIRAKLFKQAFVPGVGVALFPMAAWTAASNFSILQDSMDASTATGVAFAGILAYGGFTAAIGVVATATANDQMIRVTWAKGIPLHQRWLRENERAALDKVACSFGFSETTRHGEEEGAQFQALREYILQKGMVLDQIDLMEGVGG